MSRTRTTRHPRQSAGKPCPGCGRSRRLCWALPCLFLEGLSASAEEGTAGGLKALDSWARDGGGLLVTRAEPRT